MEMFVSNKWDKFCIRWLRAWKNKNDWGANDSRKQLKVTFVKSKNEVKKVYNLKDFKEKFKEAKEKNN